MKHTFRVPDMSCGHCQSTIDKALRKNGIQDFEIKLAEKFVEINSEKDPDELMVIIKDAGYSPEQK